MCDRIAILYSKFKKMVRHSVLALSQFSKTIFAPMFVGLWLLASPMNAADGAWQMDSHGQLRLISAQDDITGQISLGLHVQLKPGWKTYWRYPGEAGAPPLFDWSGSENLADAEILWPAPKRFSAFGYDSFGYEKEVIWPIKLTAKDNAVPVLARLKVDYLICKNICIPKTASLVLDATADDGAGAENRTLIRHFAGLVPKSGAAAPFRFSHIALSGVPGKQLLVVKAVSTLTFDQPDLMIESKSNFGFGRPVLTLSDDRKEVVLSVPVFDLLDKDRGLAGEQLRLTLVQGSLASEQDVAIATR